MSWTEAKITVLRDSWAEGLSASDIAKRIGDVTRNAVIGKAHRLGLDHRPSPINTDVGRRKVVATQEKQAGIAEVPPPVAMGVVVAIPVPKKTVQGVREKAACQAVPLYVAQKNGPPCKWPLGDPRSRDFHFCGRETAVGRPYCPDHCTEAYIRKEARV